MWQDEWVVDPMRKESAHTNGTPIPHVGRPTERKYAVVSHRASISVCENGGKIVLAGSIIRGGMRLNRISPSKTG